MSLEPRVLRNRTVWALSWLLVTLCISAVPAVAYEVGHRVVTYTDPARGGRQIPTDLYYPADLGGENVPVAAAPPGGFPVLAFGHGYLIGTSYHTYLWEGLVPAGYILALPRTEGGLLPNHQALGLDLAFLPRKLREEGQTPGSAFHGAVASTAALLGHSMGGGASVLGAASADDVTAIANLAAANTNPSAIGAAALVTVPALLLSGGNDCVASPAQHQIPIYEALASSWKVRLTIDGASHCQFVEAGSLCVLGEGGCPAPTITHVAQKQLTLQLLRPWLDFTLKADRDAWAEFAALLNSLPGISFSEAGYPTGVGDEGGQGEFAGGQGQAGLWLAPPRPNPIQHGTELRYHLPTSGLARIDIYSLAGRRVRSIWAGGLEAGWHAVWWDGRDQTGRPAAAGVYFASLRMAGSARTKPLLIVR